jgi:hypothetical protein
VRLRSEIEVSMTACSVSESQRGTWHLLNEKGQMRGKTMTLTLELTSEQEQQLEAEARQRNLDATSYAITLLFEKETTEYDMDQVLPPPGPLPPANGAGADLVAYWEREGLIGTRSEIKDSLEHAREIRRTAERRVRE